MTYLSAEDMAAQLGLSAKQVHTMARRYYDPLPHVRVGWTRVFSPRKVATWMKREEIRQARTRQQDFHKRKRFLMLPTRSHA
jgi:hypothetical protein